MGRTGDPIPPHSGTRADRDAPPIPDAPDALELSFPQVGIPVKTPNGKPFHGRSASSGSPDVGRVKTLTTLDCEKGWRTMAVDALDTRILRLMIEQPRTSVREYARILGIARGTLQARIDRLERHGVITGTGPALSPAALGHPVLAFVHIEVTQGHLDEVGDALAAVPEIIEAFSITGGGDLLTRVVARDNGHLEDVVQQLIQLPGVVRTRTEMALRERVPHRLLPLVESVGRAVPQQ